MFSLDENGYKPSKFKIEIFLTEWVVASFVFCSQSFNCIIRHHADTKHILVIEETFIQRGESSKSDLLFFINNKVNIFVIPLPVIKLFKFLPVG